MSEVLEVKSRIKALLRERRVTENQLSADGRFSQKTLNNQISHGATLTVEMLLFSFFPASRRSLARKNFR